MKLFLKVFRTQYFYYVISPAWDEIFVTITIHINTRNPEGMTLPACWPAGYSKISMEKKFQIPKG
jgi:hypothetical protein